MDKIKFDSNIKEVIDQIMKEVSIVKPGEMFGYPAYYVNRKMCACIYEDGVGIKVPEEKARELLEKENISHFQPMGRKPMKEWIRIKHADPDDFKKDIEIFDVSISYVASLGR